MSETVQINRSFSRVNGRLHYHGKPMIDGPWHGEPDRVEFEHAGFACLVLRGGSSWCGYVGVPPGHPWHGVQYDNVRAAGDEWPDVHGGLTYSNECAGNICHVPKPGEPEHLWWVGFDCGHSGDVCAYNLLGEGYPFEPFAGDIYRDVEYVKRQTVGLAEQAKAVRL